MTDAHPFDAAAPDGIGERIERVADQAENVPDADLFEGADKGLCDSLCHECLQNCEVILSPPISLTAQGPLPAKPSVAGTL
jgi:hypothetical protein